MIKLKIKKEYFIIAFLTIILVMTISIDNVKADSSQYEFDKIKLEDLPAIPDTKTYKVIVNQSTGSNQIYLYESNSVLKIWSLYDITDDITEFNYPEILIKNFFKYNDLYFTPNMIGNDTKSDTYHLVDNAWVLVSTNQIQSIGFNMYILWTNQDLYITQSSVYSSHYSKRITLDSEWLQKNYIHKDYDYLRDNGTAQTSIKIVSTNQTDYDFININFNDYQDSSYHYLYSEDNTHYKEITDNLDDYTYIYKQYYNTTVSAQVTDANGSIIASKTLNIADLTTGYYAWVHTELTNQDYGIWLSQSDHTSKIIEGKNFDSLDDRYPLHYYTNEDKTDEIVIDDNSCLAKNIDVYINWLMFPTYIYTLYYEENQLYIQFNFTNFLDNGLMIEFNNLTTPVNFTFNYANSRPKFKVTAKDNIDLKYFIEVDSQPKQLKLINFTIDDILNEDKNSDIKDEYNIDHKYDNSSDVVSQNNNIMTMFQSIFDNVKDIIIFFWSKMNKYIKLTFIYVIVLKLIKGVIGLLNYKGVM